MERTQFLCNLSQIDKACHRTIDGELKIPNRFLLFLLSHVHLLRHHAALSMVVIYMEPPPLARSKNGGLWGPLPIAPLY